VFLVKPELGAAYKSLF